MIDEWIGPAEDELQATSELVDDAQVPQADELRVKNRRGRFLAAATMLAGDEEGQLLLRATAVPAVTTINPPKMTMLEADLLRDQLGVMVQTQRGASSRPSPGSCFAEVEMVLPTSLMRHTRGAADAAREQCHGDDTGVQEAGPRCPSQS